MTVEELFANHPPLRFWVCPAHPGGRVAWSQKTARCLTCGRTNQVMPDER